MGWYKRLDPALKDLIKTSGCIVAWYLLYGAPQVVFKTGYADCGHVLFEGVIALLLLVLAVRDGPARKEPRPAGRTPRRVLLIAVAVPVFLLKYAAIQAFCLTDAYPYGGDPEDLMGRGMYAWYALRTCFTAPIMEELGCRWIIFGRLRRTGTGFWTSALFSALMFGYIHAETSPALALAAIPSALLYCLLYEITGAPWCCVAAHAAYNLLALPGREAAVSWPNTLLYGVPRRISIPLLMAVSAVILLLCLFRDRLFYSRGECSRP